MSDFAVENAPYAPQFAPPNQIYRARQTGMDMNLTNSSSHLNYKSIGDSWPVHLQLILLIGFIFLGTLLGSFAVWLFGQEWGYDLPSVLATFNEHSDRSTRRFIRWSIFINHLCTFLLPALATAWVLFRAQWPWALKVHRPPHVVLAGWGVLFILVSFPLAQALYWINHQMPLPEWMVHMEDATNEMIKALLVMETPHELLVNLLIIALVPAIGEEFIFRGLLQQTFEKMWGQGIAAIWITALLFSAFHMQFEGFLPRFALGAVLGYLFYWTRNLWIPILAHFANNAVQVLAAYYFRELVVELEPESAEPFTWPSSLASLALVLLIGHHIHRLVAEETSTSTSTQNHPTI